MDNQFYQAFDIERHEMPARSVAEEYRTPFQIDRDRIIHTSAFRRLQNKTQVFLSGEYDFYRTRLTHSIEVAQIGRSLCSRLKSVSPHLGDSFFVDPDLVEAACLAHDIGHPPFGHTGEKALHRLMRRHGGFEGNAQTLRMLSQTIYGTQRGMNPTRALVDAVLKYKTLFGEVPEQKNHFLYAQQEDWLAFVTGGRRFPDDLPPGKPRNSFRSIECQIMDWADDTAYSLNDIADGIHAGFLTCEKIERWAAASDLPDSDSEIVDELLSTIRRGRIESFMGMQIGDFIAAASLEESDTFLSDLTNRHRFRLVIDPGILAVCELFKRLSVALVFKSRQLQQLDRKSDFILTRLFGVFSDYYIEVDEKRDDHFQLFDDAEENLIFSLESPGERARVVCDILARMTDGVAGRTYKRLFDAEYGSIVDLI